MNGLDNPQPSTCAQSPAHVPGWEPASALSPAPASASVSTTASRPGSPPASSLGGDSASVSATAGAQEETGASPRGIVPSPDSEMSLTRASRTLGRDRRDEAISRTAAYLQCLGLTDQAIAEGKATQLIDQIMAHPSCWLRNRAVGQAVDAAIVRINKWTNELAAERWLSQGHWLPGEEGFTLHMVRRVIRDQPQMILAPLSDLAQAQAPRPGEPGQTGKLSARPAPPGPIFPPLRERKMPRQQFGKLPTMFRLGFWQRIYRRWRMFGRVIVRQDTPKPSQGEQIA